MNQKKNKTKRIEMNIADHLVCALVNADVSGLEDSDIKAIDNTIENYGPYFYIYCPSETETNFSRCDITSLLSDCLTVTVEVSA